MAQGHQTRKWLSLLLLTLNYYVTQYNFFDRSKTLLSKIILWSEFGLHVSSLLFEKHKNITWMVCHRMWVSIHVGERFLWLLTASLRLKCWEKINLKDPTLPYLLRFGILKLSFGYKCFNLYSLLILINAKLLLGT